MKTKVFPLFFASLLFAFSSPHLLAANSCELYPIALAAQQLSNAVPGVVLTNIFNGTQPGNFGWLTWAGSPSEPTLVKSLTAPGDSDTYVNPDNSLDHQVSVSDWVQGKPGVSNAKNVRDALDALKQIDITVPVWDQTRGTGANAAYRVSNFAKVRLISYQLPSQNRITVKFLGFVTCGTQNHAPIVNAGADQTILLSNGAVLNGSATDDGLPTGSTLSPTWSVLSGPGPVQFGNANAFVTTASFTITGRYDLRLTVSDSQLSGSDDLVILVNQPNRPPTVPDFSVTNNEDVPVNITLTGTDPDNNPLTFSVVVFPVHGTLSGTPPNLLYTPAQDFNGSDSFTYKANDGELDSAPGLVSITIRPVNDPPVADPQTVSTPEDTGVPIVLSGADVEGSPLTFQIVGDVTNGYLTQTSSNIVYTPNANFNGSDQFTFKVNDGTNDSALATVVIVVEAVNDPPFAEANTVSTPEDTGVDVLLTGFDVEGNSLAFVVVSQPQHGVLTGTAPHLRFTPAPDFNGADSFTFRVNDGELDSTVATVSITVDPVNDAPVAQPQSVIGNEDTDFPITLTGTDVDGDTLTFTVLTQPAHGTLSGTAPDLVYRPATNYNGSDSFTFKVNDGTEDSLAATVQLTIYAVNDAPEATPQALAVNEDTALDITLSGTDIENDALGFEVLSEPAHGVLVGIPPDLTYLPFTNYFGPDSFTFRAFDYGLDSTPATIAITVLPVNDPPIANGQSITTAEDVSIAITLSGSDVEGDALSFAVVVSPTHGSLSGTLPNLTYTPAPNFFGSDTFTFKANDGQADSAPAAITITVTPVNDAPVAIAQSVTTAEDTSVAINLTATDVEGDSLSFAVVSGPAHGTLSGTAPNLTYTPAANYYGPDSFTFKANDGALDSAAATVSITVTPVNDAPFADSQSVSVNEDTALALTLTGSDIEGSSLTLVIVTVPAHGTLSGTPPNVTYQPATNYNGSDSFTFKVNDGELDSAPATVSITINPVNDAPVANNQTLTVAEDTALSITLTGSDVENSPLSFAVITGPAHGTLSGTAPNLTYQPATNYSGPDSFTFKANDGGLDSAAVTVTILITPVNDAPVATAQSVTLDEDASAAIALAGTDVEGSTLSFTIVTSPAHGTLSGTPPNVTYQPATNYNGTDSFTFKVNDGELDSAPATVSITINPINDAPVANSQSVTNNEDNALAIMLTGSDVEGSALTYSIVAGPTNGTLSGTPPNITYLANTNFNGGDSFTFKVNDGELDSAEATVSITILPVNDAPIANNQSVSLDEDTTLAVTLTGSDVEGSTLSFAIVTSPVHGTLSGTPPNVTYQPAPNYYGADSFTFSVNDGELDSAPATVSITINPVNDAPVANNQSVTNNEDTVLAIALTGSDVEGSALTYSIVTGPAHGTLSGTPPNVSYLPTTNYFGGDSFTFKVNDGELDSSAATITITVLPVNDAPVANNQMLTVNEDTALSITLTASDVEGDALNYSVVTGPVHGTLSGTAPNLVYLPNTNFNGADSFTFKANDGTVDSTVATISITVAPVNDAPLANNQSVSLNEDSSVAITLTGSDVEGSALTFSVVTSPSHGTLSGTAPNVVYTPVANYYGPDSFTFKVNDGALDSTPATVSITVAPVNDPPIIVSIQAPTTVIYPSNATFRATVTDDGTPVGVPLTYLWEQISGPASVAFSNASSTNTTATFSAGGTYTFRFTVSDSEFSATTNITVLVRTNQPPVVSAGPDRVVAFSSSRVDLGGTNAGSGFQLIKIATQFNSPIGIDHHAFSGKLLMSVNYPSGQPYNFELVAPDGSRSPLSAIHGFTDELKIATARDDGTGHSLGGGGFLAGETFSASGVPGVIIRISPDGSTFQNPWVTLPGEGGLLRGSLYVDRTGVFGGALIVVTTAGGVWKVTSAGVPTKLAQINTHLEGLCTIPNDSTKYGPWAGKALIGAEEQGLLYSVTPQGTVASYSLGINPEDIDIIPFGENFYGVDFAGQTLWGAPASSFTGLNGDILIAQEFPGILWHVHWNGTQFVKTQLASVSQWEHVTFSPAGVGGITVFRDATLNGSVSDDGLPLSATVTSLWTKVSGPGIVSFSDPFAAVVGASFSQTGTYVLRLTAGDTEFATSDDVTVTVYKNQAPLVSAGPDRSVAHTNEVITLHGTATDDGIPPGTPLEINWTMVAGPGNATFGDSHSAETTVSFDTPGIYILKLTANDSVDEVSDLVEVRAAVVCTVDGPPGLAAWWPGNSSGDEKVGGRSAALGEGAGYAVGRVGTAFNFDGVNANATVAANSSLDVGAGGSFTIEFWMNASSSGSGGTLVGWQGSSVNGVLFQRSGNSFYTYLADTNGGVRDFFTSGGIVPGTWQHVALTYNKTNAQTRIYVDGSLFWIHNSGTFTPRTSLDLYFGKRPGDSVGFNGRLDEISLYNRALDGQEINEIYAAGATGKCPIDLNNPPIVNAGTDLSVRDTNAVVSLAGTVVDDALPIDATLTIQWSKAFGPGIVSFTDATVTNTTATFSAPGVYVLKLTANDSSIERSDLVEVRVGALCTIKDPPGLAAWWPGNGNANEVVNGNNGRLLNGVTFAPGEVAAAFSFDGTNDGVRVPANTNLNVGQGGSFTTEFWMNAAADGSAGLLFGWQSLSANGVLFFRSGNSFYTYMADTNGGVRDFFTSGGITPNTWQHVALTYDRAIGQTRIYINGALFWIHNSGTFTPQTRFDFYFGQRDAEVGFKGLLDEMSLYNRALDGQEIYELFAAGSVGKCPKDANSAPFVNAGPDLFAREGETVNLHGTVTDDGRPLGAGLRIAWSKFDGPGNAIFANPASTNTTVQFSTPGIYVLKLSVDDSLISRSDLVQVRVDAICDIHDQPGLAAWWPGNGTADDVVHGQNGRLVNGTKFAPGRISAAFSFDGTNDGVRVPASTNLNVGQGGSFTAEFWMNAAADGNTGLIFGWQSLSANGVLFFRSGNSFYTYMADTNGGVRDFFTSGGITPGTWQHVAVTYDRAIGQTRIYVNGALFWIHNSGVFTPQTRFDFYLGQRDSEIGFKGLLDEVSLYSRALNGQEIYDLFAAAYGQCPIDGNEPPFVDAGPDLVLRSTSDSAVLNGFVTDDGLPLGSTVESLWRKFDGPGNVTFANPNSPATTATFDTPGIYVLQLAADDSSIEESDLIEVRVGTPCTIKDPPGLAAWWPGNGNANDVVNGNNGLLVNGTTFATGKVSAAFSFDGTNDGVRAAASSSLNVGLGGSFTAEFWMNAAASGSGGLIFGWQGLTANGVLFFRSGNSFYTYMADTNGGVRDFFTSGGIAPGTWQHVAVTYDRAIGQTRIYVNGALFWIHNSGVFTPQTRFDFNFGQRDAEVGFKGLLDEMSLYSRALDGQEIYELFAAGSVGKCPKDANQAPTVFAGPDLTLAQLTNAATLNGVATDDGLPSGSTLKTTWSKFQGPGNVTFANSNSPATTATFSAPGIYLLQLLASDGEITRSDIAEVRVATPCVLTNISGLAAWWPGNGTPDEVIGGQDFRLFAGASFTTGRVSAAFAFDGDNDSARAPASTNLNVGRNGAFTVEFWMNASSSGSGGLIFGWQGLSANGVLFFRSGNSFYTYLADTNGGVRDFFTSGGIAPGTWQHIAVTYDRAIGQTTIYTNGTLFWTHNSGVFTPRTSFDFYIGQRDSEVGFKGLLDEVSLYSRALSQGEIQSIFNAGATGKCPIVHNEAPSVFAGSDQTIYLPNSVTLHGSVFDDGLPVGNPLTTQWSYLSGPATVFFSTTNQPVTTISFTNTGVYTFRLTASDGEFTVSDDVVVTVVPDPRTPPSVAITSPANHAVFEIPSGGATNVTVTATASDNDGAVAHVELFQNGTSLRVFNSGPYSFTASNLVAGSYTFTAVATDNDGLSRTSAPVTVTVYIDTGGPVVALYSPLDGSAITAPTGVTGTVASAIVDNWALQYRLKPADNDLSSTQAAFNWITIATGTSAVTSNALGALDPTLLLNGIYELQLVATDLRGRIGIADSTFVADRNMKVGHFTLSFNDLTIPVAGIPIQVIRTYDSRDKRNGDFGVGWTLSLANIRLQKNRNLGASWEQTFQSGGLGQYCLNPRRPRVVTITFPDGKTQKFEAHTSPECQPFEPIPEATVIYRPQANTRGTLVAEGAHADEVTTTGLIGDTELFNSENLATYNPTLFRYTSDEGEVYIIDEREGLKSMTDRNGNRLTVNTNGIVWTNTVTGGPGKTVAFQRDNLGRITNILDAAGNAMRYRYNTNGDLVSFVDRVNLTNTFSYNTKHEMLTLVDARGITAARNEYDDAGRLVRQIDAAGNTNNFTHDLDARAEIIRDRLGFVTVHEYDENGNITRTIDALNNVTLMTYDANDNLLTKVDALGNTNRFTYDAHDNKLTETDPLGNTTTYTYNAFKQPTSIRNARGFTTTNLYDASGNLTAEIDPLNHRTDYSYDGKGNILMRTDALGNTIENLYDQFGHLTNTIVRDVNLNALNTTAFAYDANGNQTNKTTWRTTPSGVEMLVTRYVYDSGNRLVLTVQPDGSTNATIYNAISKPALSIDALGRQTLMMYDDRGNLTRTTYPDSTFDITFYDAENRRVGMQDKAGRITGYTNDALGRSVITVYPDNTGTTNFYDAIGRVFAMSDARGNTTFYGFDAVGRRTSVTNALGQVSRSVFDEAGNLVRVIDTFGRTNTFAYDELNRRRSVLFPDGTAQSAIYDELGRRIAETDQSFNTTLFGYDALGRLIAVTNALGNVTRYEYNEQGQQTAQIDAELRTTRFEYDQLGRRTQRILPLNQFETYAYDVAGQMTNRTDFNGRTTTFIHDVMNRLVAKVPDASFSAPTVQFSYNELGLRTNMVDASGVTTYRYDNRNRLIEKAAPEGTLAYSYNANGQVTNIHSLNVNGVTLNYGYDELNRLSEVNDPHAGRTTYTYDDVGNLRGYTYPNGVNTFYEYNALNRLTNMNVSAGLTPVANYAYTLAPSGHRTSAVETRFVNPQPITLTRLYGYDQTYRLTNETIGGTGYTSPAMLDYSYDRIGNRLQLQSTQPGIVSQLSSYDANDRLISDSYDNNGNTLTSPSFGMAQSDRYDFENRLTRRMDNNKTVTIVYDGDGNRVKKTVTTSTNTVTTWFLVDMVNPTGYAQVLEEITTDTLNPQLATPQVTRTYSYGHDLVSQDQIAGNTWTISFYGYDGHGNTRFLTDANGLVSDTYDYDAFGNLIARSGTTPNLYLYCGEQSDHDLGLYFLRARYHNPSTGRFWNMDSFDGKTSNPTSLHKYLYANANPINMVDPTGFATTTVAEINVTSALIAAFEKTLVVLALAVYGAHYAGRDYTVYSCWGVDPQYGWGHAFMAVLDRDGTGGWRYDLWPASQFEYGRAVNSPWKFFSGFVEKTSVSGIPGGIPVAKFNPGNLAIWESVIQLQAISLEIQDLFATPFSYSYYLSNCYEWTIGATVVALPISLLPFPNSFGHFF